MARSYELDHFSLSAVAVAALGFGACERHPASELEQEGGPHPAAKPRGEAVDHAGRTGEGGTVATEHKREGESAEPGAMKHESNPAGPVDTKEPEAAPAAAPTTGPKFFPEAK